MKIKKINYKRSNVGDWLKAPEEKAFETIVDKINEIVDLLNRLRFDSPN